MKTIFRITHMDEDKWIATGDKGAIFESPMEGTPDNIRSKLTIGTEIKFNRSTGDLYYRKTKKSRVWTLIKNVLEIN